MNNSVYIGAWVNWSHGRFNGLTLTVAQPWADVLVATIALFVALTGAQIWGIVCFATFRIRQSAAGNCVHHHVQTALRHSCNSPVLFTLRLTEILWSRFRGQHDSSADASRLMQDFKPDEIGDGNQPASQQIRQKRNSSVPLLLLLALTVVFAISLTAISLLSAQAFKAPDDTALIASPYCGWPPESNNLSSLSTFEEKEVTTLLLVPARSQYETARKYARSCYADADDGQVPGGEKQCNGMVMPLITSTRTMKKKCFFPDSGICKTDAARIESSYVDSRDTLGINTPDEDRISFKKSLTCAPIDLERWATGWVDAEPFGGVPSDTGKAYALGKVAGSEGIFADHSFAVTNYSLRMSSEPYSVYWLAARYGDDSESDFIPRAELNVTDADLTIISLSSTAFFDQQIRDPWFNMSVSGTDSSNYTLWQAPIGLSFIGCLEQYQVCASGTCSQPSALYQLAKSPNYGLPNLTQSRKAVADVVWKTLWAGQIRYALQMIGGQLLVANEKVMGSLYMRSSKIPDDQWVTETWNLANISLAILQRRPGDYASPAPLLQQNPSRIVRPDTKEAVDLCAQMRIRTARYTSFRIVGLAMLAAATAFAAALNRVLPRLFSGRSKAEKRKGVVADWSRYNFYHLVMAVGEARDVGPWTRKDKDVPVMVDGGREFRL